MQKTTIEYLTHTWNPLAMRCTPISEGCTNCWHLKFANRHAHNPKFSLEMRKAYAGGAPYLREDELQAPLRLKTPSRIGIEFMGDLFHEDVPFEFISKVVCMIVNCPQHIFIMLTKRPTEMYFAITKLYLLAKANQRDFHIPLPEMPFKNLYLGITCENQETFNKRWAILKQIPAAVYMISYEPALGPLILSPDFLALGKRAFLVCGGESGPGARPMHPSWARGVRDQCVEAGVSYFFKQWGEHFPVTSVLPEIDNTCSDCASVEDCDRDIDCLETFDSQGKGLEYFEDKKLIGLNSDGSRFIVTTPHKNKLIKEDKKPWWFAKVGKKAAGRELDGRIWSQFPEQP